MPLRTVASTDCTPQNGRSPSARRWACPPPGGLGSNGASHTVELVKTVEGETPKRFVVCAAVEERLASRMPRRGRRRWGAGMSEPQATRQTFAVKPLVLSKHSFVRGRISLSYNDGSVVGLRGDGACEPSAGPARK